LATESYAASICEFEGQVVMSNGKRFKCLRGEIKPTTPSLKNPVLVVLDQTESFPYHHEVNKVDAQSVITTVSCPNKGETRVDTYFCIVWRSPYTTFTFLFRPFLGPDITSSSSLFAAMENVFWLASTLFVLIMFIRNRRLAFFSALAPSLVFMSIYSVAAGAYEGNMGTAFRHKSLILWVVILLLASTIVATKERKTENKELTS